MLTTERCHWPERGTKAIGWIATALDSILALSRSDAPDLGGLVPRKSRPALRGLLLLASSTRRGIRPT